jgi:hypothetical protein
MDYSNRKTSLLKIVIIHVSPLKFYVLFAQSYYR